MTIPQQATPNNRPSPEGIQVDPIEAIRRQPGKPLKPFLPAYLDDLPDNTLLLPSEVGDLFRVDPKTVTRWVGRPNSPLIAYRTPGGHLRLQCKNVREIFTKASGELVVNG